MNRIGRAIAGLALLSIAAVSVVAAASSTAVGKSYDTAVPQYVQGYWPDEDPALCIWDRTDGLPVAEAVAQFAATNVDVAMSDGCDDDAVDVKVMAVPAMWCEGPDGCHRRSPDSVRDDDDLWIYRPGAEITLNAKSDLTGQQWLGVIVHELGHLVGLGHTNRLDSIMRAGSTGTSANGDGLDGLTATDIAVINDLYS